MPVTGTGWELHLQRLGVHKSGSLQRTYGKYQVHINGSVVESLTGFIGERLGPATWARLWDLS